MGETPLKHWNQKWNIECQCFTFWKYWLSMHCVMRMKHGTKKRLKVNIMYARVRSAFNWVQCVLTGKQRVLTWGRRVPPGEGASPPQVRTRRQRTYIYTRGIILFMFFNTKHKKIVPIICSFKAESVLLPCYSFPAKKSLKKVSFFKSLVYNVLRI